MRPIVQAAGGTWRAVAFPQTGPLAKAAEPLAGAVYLDFAGIPEAATPWIDLAEWAANQENASRFRDQQVADEPKVGEGLGDRADDSAQVKKILDQIHLGLRVLSAFRTYSSVTYAEDEALVKHSEWHVVDLE